MAYVSQNLRLVTPAFAAQGPSIWTYNQTTDNNATVNANGYFTDGGIKGVKVGDYIISVNTNTPDVRGMLVTAVATTGNGALTTGTSIQIG